MFRIASLVLGASCACLWSAPSFAGHGVSEHQLLRAALANAPGHRLTALTVTYAPGARSLPHHHDASAYVYVLSGHIRSRVAGAPVRVYGPGQSWFEAPGAHHVICENASATEPARMLVVFIAAPHAALSTPDH